MDWFSTLLVCGTLAWLFVLAVKWSIRKAVLNWANLTGKPLKLRKTRMASHCGNPAIEYRNHPLRGIVQWAFSLPETPMPESYTKSIAYLEGRKKAMEAEKRQ